MSTIDERRRRNAAPLVEAQEPTVYETTRCARVLGISFAQTKALLWLAARRPPFFERDYREAGITTRTMGSLARRNLVTFGQDVAGGIWYVTAAGRAALIAARES